MSLIWMYMWLNTGKGCDITVRCMSSTSECVMSHIRMSHVRSKYESCHSYEWTFSYVWSPWDFMRAKLTWKLWIVLMVWRECISSYGLGPCSLFKDLAFLSLALSFISCCLDHVNLIFIEGFSCFRSFVRSFHRSDGIPSFCLSTVYFLWGRCAYVFLCERNKSDWDLIEKVTASYPSRASLCIWLCNLMVANGRGQLESISSFFLVAEREPQREAAVSFRTVVTFVTWLISSS